MLRHLPAHRVGKGDDLRDGDEQLVGNLCAEFDFGQHFYQGRFLIDRHVMFAREFDDSFGCLTASLGGDSWRALAIPMQGDRNVNRYFRWHCSNPFVDQLAGADARSRRYRQRRDEDLIDLETGVAQAVFEFANTRAYLFVEFGIRGT